METLLTASYLTTHLTTTGKLPLQFSGKPIFKIQLTPLPYYPLPSINSVSSSKYKLYCLSTRTISTTRDAPVESSEQESFDWYAHWYPIMPVCDLDKRVPHAKKVLGIDVVVWWNRNENAWKVFDDACPHRLAPLSEGRIDQWGRLQCVYHGWCFNDSGDCMFIPQAPLDGPPIHTNKRIKL